LRGWRGGGESEWGVCVGGGDYGAESHTCLYEQLQNGRPYYSALNFGGESPFQRELYMLCACTSIHCHIGVTAI